jgi:ferredoxin
MQVAVDRGKCRGIGLCEALCPEMFEVDDDGTLQLINGETVPDQYIADVDRAIGSCPTGSLSKHT